MGTPVHFSRELPERCMLLIERLLPTARETRAPDQPHNGPLTTTFLVAMAMPILTLPMERVKRHRERAIKGNQGYMDDRAFSAELAAAVDTALGQDSLSNAPFYRKGHWRFYQHAFVEGTNLARSFPDDAARALRRDDAVTAADQMPCEQWSACLRNALAHGGVTYLDENGSHSFGADAKMIAFSSAKYKDRDTNVPPEKLRHLRIAETDFLEFLRLWVGWLRSANLSVDLAA